MSPNAARPTLEPRATAARDQRAADHQPRCDEAMHRTAAQTALIQRLTRDRGEAVVAERFGTSEEARDMQETRDEGRETRWSHPPLAPRPQPLAPQYQEVTR